MRSEFGQIRVSLPYRGNIWGDVRDDLETLDKIQFVICIFVWKFDWTNKLSSFANNKWRPCSPNSGPARSSLEQRIWGPASSFENRRRQPALLRPEVDWCFHFKLVVIEMDFSAALILAPSFWTASKSVGADSIISARYVVFPRASSSPRSAGNNGPLKIRMLH